LTVETCGRGGSSITLEEWNNYGLKHAVHESQQLDQTRLNLQPLDRPRPSGSKQQKDSICSLRPLQPSKASSRRTPVGEPDLPSPTAGQDPTTADRTKLSSFRTPIGSVGKSGRPLQTRRASTTIHMPHSRITDKPLLMPSTPGRVNAHNASTITLGVTAQAGRARSIIKNGNGQPAQN